jgi:hypothetical protein
MGNSNVQAVPSARDVGVKIDSTMSLEKHISSVCQSAYYQLKNIGSIRNCLDRKTTDKLVYAFLASRLDSCNAVLVGLPDNLLQKLYSPY